MNPKELSCNLCSGREFKVLYREGLFKLCRCVRCGLIYVNPHPQKANLFEHYDKNYYAPWLKSEIKERRKMWRRRLNKIESFKARGRLLDVGCGTGLFLDEAKNRGWEVFGTEVSKYARDYIRKSFGIEVFHGEFKDNVFDEGFFDVVTFWHVLEHMFDPLGNLIEAYRVLKPGGLIVIAVPNVNNYIFQAAYLCVKFRKLKPFSLNNREVHLYHFSPNTLKKMIEKAGFLPLTFDIDREKIGFASRFLNSIACFIYKISGINLGMAIEAFARKE